MIKCSLCSLVISRQYRWINFNENAWNKTFNYLLEEVRKFECRKKLKWSLTPPIACFREALDLVSYVFIFLACLSWRIHYHIFWSKWPRCSATSLSIYLISHLGKGQMGAFKEILIYFILLESVDTLADLLGAVWVL